MGQQSKSTMSWLLGSCCSRCWLCPVFHAMLQGVPCYAAAEEQLMVESYFSSALASFINYYIGLERPGPVGSPWYLSDGTPVGNGLPSNSDPYAHW